MNQITIDTKKYTAVIFDMDGVLVDSQPLHFDCDINVLSHFGINVGLNIIKNYAGMSADDRFTKFIDDFKLPASVDEIKSVHLNIMKKLLSSSSLTSTNGMTELLSALREKNIPVAVASSSSYDFIFEMLSKISLASYFDKKYIVSGEDLKNGKPHPDIFLKTANIMQKNPSECIVIEDSTSGVLAAKRAEMFCIAYNNPTSGMQDLFPADVISESFFDVLVK